MKTIINWKVFWILLAAAILATILLLPYAMEVQSSAIDLTKLPIPLPVVLTLQIVQNAILFAIAIFGGLFFAGRVGLGTPILDSVTRGESVADRVRRDFAAQHHFGRRLHAGCTRLGILLLSARYAERTWEYSLCIKSANIATRSLERVPGLILWWHR